MICDSSIEHRKFIANAPVHTHSINRDGQFTTISNAWASELLYEPSEMIGKRAVDFLMPWSRYLALNIMLPRFFAEGIVTDVPYTFQRSDGSLAHITMSAGCLRENGEVVRSLAVMNFAQRGETAESAKQNLADFVIKDGIPADVAKVIIGLT